MPKGSNKRHAKQKAINYSLFDKTGQKQPSLEPAVMASETDTSELEKSDTETTGATSKPVQPPGTEPTLPGGESEVIDGSSSDECNALGEMKAKLEAEKKRLLKQQRKKQLKAEIQGLQTSVAALKESETAFRIPKARTGNINRTGAKAADLKTTDLNTLRSLEELNNTVSLQMRSLGLEAEGADDEDSDEDDGTQKPHSTQRDRSTSRGRASGINARASQSVVAPQIWPHTVLQLEYAARVVQFKDLDFRLMVAGEIEIIKNVATPPAEKAGRLDLLQKIAYYKEMYEWAAILDFYAAWVRKIELGQKRWEDDSSVLETPLLARFVIRKTQKDTTRFGPNSSFKGPSLRAEPNPNIAWYCSLYQRNKCTQQGPHTATIRGQLRLLQHICATCYQTDKAQNKHPESPPSVTSWSLSRQPLVGTGVDTDIL